MSAWLILGGLVLGGPMPTPTEPPTVQVHMDVLVLDGPKALFEKACDRTDPKAPACVAALTGEKTVAWLTAVRTAKLNGEVSIVSHPQIMTLSGQSARVMTGQSVPVVRPGSPGTSADVREVDFHPVGMELSVTPIVVADKGSVYLEATVRHSSVNKAMGISTAAGVTPGFEEHAMTASVELMPGGALLMFSQVPGETPASCMRATLIVPRIVKDVVMSAPPAMLPPPMPMPTPVQSHPVMPTVTSSSFPVGMPAPPAMLPPPPAMPIPLQPPVMPAAFPVVYATSQVQAPLPSQPMPVDGGTSRTTRLKQLAAVIAAEYHRAADEGDSGTAAKLARMAVSLDPFCFRGPTPVVERPSFLDRVAAFIEDVWPFQTYVQGMTAPTAQYLEYPPQYLPPAPEFPLAKELATMQAQAGCVVPPATVAPMPAYPVQATYMPVPPPMASMPTGTAPVATWTTPVPPPTPMPATRVLMQPRRLMPPVQDPK